MSRSILAVVFAMLLVVAPVSTFAQSPDVVRVTAERTSVRDRAATDGSVVTSVTQGDQLQVLQVSGSWFRVRTSTGVEGFVHSLFVERMAGAAAPAPSVAPPGPSAAPAPVASQVSAQASAPRFGGDGTDPLGGRRFGIGLMNIGPSVRYWMDARKGFQVDFNFSSSNSHRVIAIAPSFMMRFKEPTHADSFEFLPYWGGGVSIWRFSDGYRDYYCREFNDCSTTSIGYGAFVGSEVIFESLPKLGVSGQVGYYSGALGYGGIGASIGVHFYPGAKPR